MGYVGCVSAACLANDGHVVTGIEVDGLKVKMINDGKSPIIEPGLQEAIEQAIHSRRLRATVNDAGPAEISIVCVGTPSNENGSLQLDYIKRVARQIGRYVRQVDTYHVVNIRSTVLPGTIEAIVIPLIEEHSQKSAGVHFGICMNPEFMREGASIHDFHNPPFTLIGELDEQSGGVVAKMYEGLEAPLLRSSIRVAEMIKYACNSFHALKVSFANEIGNLCKRLNLDSHEVMDIFCKDQKLNLSPYYLKPGFAFGGSCLPKDLRALLYKARELDLELPILSSILKSNANQIDAAYDMVKKTGMRNVGILGLSFKPGTDDLRESPMVEFIEKLLGKGYRLSLYDREVSLARVFGSNKKYIESIIPHISSLMKDSAAEVVDNSQVIIFGKKCKEYEDLASRIAHDKFIIDLARIASNQQERNGRYAGICW
jgi:GDP-mannose 6-dehydrogenase